MGCSLASKWERGRHQPPMQDCRCLAEKPGEQRHQQKANQGNTAASHELFHTQIGVGNRLDGGRRRVKKYLWSFLRTAPAGAGQAVTCSTSGMGLRLK